MSLGRRCVNYASVLSALLVTVAAEAHRNLPGDLPAQAWASSILADLPDGYIVAPFENASPVKQLDWMSSALAVTVAEKLEALPGLRPTYGAKTLEGFENKFDPEKVARRAHDAGAKWVFAGSFSRPNWKSAMSLKLYTVVEPSDAVPNVTLRLVAETSSTGEREKLMDQHVGFYYMWK